MARFFNFFCLTCLIMSSLSAELNLQIKAYDDTDIDCVYEIGAKDKPFVVFIVENNGDLKNWEPITTWLLDKDWGYLAYTPRVFQDAEEPNRESSRNLWRNKQAQYNASMLLQDMDSIVMFLELDYKTKILANRIILIGAGLGANIALRYSVINKKIKEVVLLSPGSEYDFVSTRGVIQSYGNRPIMFMASEKDQYSYNTCLDYISYLSGNNSFNVKFYSGQKHGTEFLGDPVPLADILAWLGVNN